MTTETLKALWVLGADYHSGFGSRGYRLMCRAARLLDKRDAGIGCTHSATRSCWDHIRATAEYVRLKPVAQRYF